MKSIVVHNARRIINERGFKNKAIAEKAGYTEKQFSNMLNGRRTITSTDVLRLSNALGVTPNDLFGFTNVGDIIGR